MTPAPKPTLTGPVLLLKLQELERNYIAARQDALMRGRLLDKVRELEPKLFLRAVELLDKELKW